MSTRAAWRERLRVRTRVEGFELAVGLVLTAVLVVSHVSVWIHSGSLWRDEVNSVNIAALPHFADMGPALKFDSVPILWPAVLRAWRILGFGGSDLAWRSLGLAIGLLLLAALWVNAWVRDRGAPPLLSLALFGSCAAFLRVGDSLRAYGFGTLLMLAAFWQVRRVLRAPTPGRAAGACLLAVLAVQALYHNVILIGIAGLAGGIAALARKDWKALAALVGMEAAAALSMLPYRGIVAGIGEYSNLVKVPLTMGSLLLAFVGAVGPLPAVLGGLLWILCAALVPVRILQPRTARPGLAEGDLGLFLWVSLVAGTAIYSAFLLKVGYVLHPWYFFSIAALLATVLDLALQAAIRDLPWARWTRLGLAGALALVMAPSMGEGARTRSSGIETMAAVVGAHADPGDLVVVNPWFMGIPFDRYYRGRAPWMTLPDIPDHRIHRYDLLKEKILTRDPVAPDLARISDTLKRGRRVWVVGRLGEPAKGGKPESLPPPADPRVLSSDIPYRNTWTWQLTYLLSNQAKVVRRLAHPQDEFVNGLEDPELFIAEGWREAR